MAIDDRMEPRSDRFRHDLIAVRRRMLGLSQAELADVAGLSQATLSKIEQGLKSVTDAVADQLARALKCPPDFFEQPEREYGAPMSAHPMFRKRASVGQRVIDKVIAEFSVRIAHARALLRAVDVEPELPLPAYESEEFGGPQGIAAAVRRAWYVPRGPLPSLVDLIERSGCILMRCDMNLAKIDAASYRVAGMPPIIFLNKALPGDRLRFSLAHELGHLVMHRYPTPVMEEEADQFASALLMPAADIGPELSGLTLAKAAALKPIWRVSMAALIYRASALGAISKTQADYLWRVRSAKGWSTQEPPALDIAPEQPSLVPALIEHFLDDAGMTQADLGRLLHLHYSEVADLYELKPPTPMQGLRRVK
jgi:Zn-dependent peptidase ImmA (M78 family)/transcriptional regulator with XRE-family HTH domain